MVDFDFTQAPYSQEAEEAVLGAILINEHSFTVVATFLKADDFFFLRNSYIWQAMYRLFERRDPIDPVTVSNELEALGYLKDIGGPAFLTQIMNSTPTSTHAEVYGRLVERAAIRRRLLKSADEIKALAADESLSIEDVQQQSTEKLLNVGITSNQAQHISVGIQEHADVVDEAMQQQKSGSLMGIPSGINGLDALLDGFHKRKVYVIAGATHHGKTSTMQTAALNAAKLGARVLFMNVADGSRLDVINRIIAMECGLPPGLIISGGLNPQQYQIYAEAASRLSKLNLYVHNHKAMTPNELYTQARLIQQQHGIDILFVDYLQRMTVGEKGAKVYRGQFEQLAYISQMLTTIADENHLNCPIVVGAQINRAGRKKVSKPPTKSDIKGCGNIEEDADAVILSWYEAVDNVNALYKDKVALIVDKNKITGRLGRVDTRIDKVTTRLFDWPANPQRFNQHVDYTDTDYRQGDSTGNLH